MKGRPGRGGGEEEPFNHGLDKLYRYCKCCSSELFFFRPAFDACCRVSVLGKKRKEKDRNNKKTHNMGITHVGGYDWTGSKLN